MYDRISALERRLQALEKQTTKDLVPVAEGIKIDVHGGYVDIEPRKSLPPNPSKVETSIKKGRGIVWYIFKIIYVSKKVTFRINNRHLKY